MGDRRRSTADTAAQAHEVPSEVAVLPLRDTVLFPGGIMPLAVGRPRSVKLIETALEESQLIALFTQRDAALEEPGQDDLYPVGTLAQVHKIFPLPDGSYRLFVEGISRIAIDRLITIEPFHLAAIHPAEEVSDDGDRKAIDELVATARKQFVEVVAASPHLSDDVPAFVDNIAEPGRLADVIASSLRTIGSEEQQTILETLDVRDRLTRLNQLLAKEIEILDIRSTIQSQVQSEMGKSQREYLLREQMKAIRKELGENDDQAKEVNELREKIEAAGMPEAVAKEARRELDRLSKMPVAAAEYTVSRTYLDWLISLPWNVRSEETIDLPRTKRTLDRGHSGLEKAKDRILEYLAVRKLKPDLKGPILCFVGPPGVGKTSLAKGIAESLDREVVRVSLGGMRDEAEIRGHRRTYIGALPGQIIRGLRRAETRNPVFILDEIDKLGTDFRGDPASALLEVLDPEQNNTFRDHYLDVPFDLSEVLFITTANFLDPVPPPLRDRMEVLELPGYTEDEKLAIATEHLVSRQVERHGLSAEQIAFTDPALRTLIRNYTREAGVRNLERELGALCRKIARRRAEGDEATVSVTPDLAAELLGPMKFQDEEVAERTRRPGVATGLAWTPAGGNVLFVEAARMTNGNRLQLTGQLGDVMKESAAAAVSWLRTNAARYQVDADFFGNGDIHIHVPSGAIPKDGPSAGLTMAVALVSELTGRPVRGDIAMSGEITLSGLVLPVGGVKEKVLAARQLGIFRVILPKRNEPYVNEELGEELRREMETHYVSTIDEALDLALTPATAPPRHSSGSDTTTASVPVADVIQ
ncbi:MAG: endopeptidase La [Acidobacteria bacterium]|nr:endopeptidase La [Acidobacteriota bacterium]MYJ05762.1 endopeptidase La [Acidobacteriota bacterium]